MERHEPHQPPAETGALAGIRVFDVSRSVAGAWCSRLLADLGADVYAGEPAAGHPLRALAVLPGGRSPIAEYLLANKRSAPVDLDSLTGVEAFTALAAGFDVVLSSFTAAKLTALGRAAAFERLAEGGAIVAHLTPHGLSGPLSTVAGNELTTAAWSGWASINGIAGREPLKPSGWQSSYCTGTAAATAIIAALLHRRRTGEALTVDIAAIEVMAAAFAPAALRAQYNGEPLTRPARQDVTNGPVEVADGHFALTLSRGHFWREAMTLLGLPDLAEDPRWETAWYRQANKALYVDRVQEAMRSWRKQDLFDELAVRRVVAGPVLSFAELRENAHLRERGYWVQAGGTSAFPGSPYRMSATPLTVRSRAPQTGAEATAPPSPATRAHKGAVDRTMRGPLAGFRGIVLTQAWAGTFCTELLAFLGADVVQVEVQKRLDSWRGSYDAPMPAKLEGVESARHPWNCNPLYNSVNLNKRCVTLDLQQPAGLEVFRRLVGHADFVAENFSPRVLGNLGIGYEALKQINPGVVLCSLSAYGQTGPWSNVPGIGGTIEPTSGMSALLGYPDGPPLNSGQMYPDAAAGFLGASAIAAALHHRERTGEGQRIDLSMQEANLAFIGEQALAFDITSTQPARVGNHLSGLAPSGVFACRDGSGWVAVACADDAEWATLRGVIPALDMFLDPEGRAGPGAEQCIADWTKTLLRDEAVARLSAAGVGVAPVLDAREVAALAHFRERGVVVDVTHPEAGCWPQVGSPFHFAGLEWPAIRPAPCLGQHNAEVFAELLGMPAHEFQALVAAGISGDSPPG